MEQSYGEPEQQIQLTSSERRALFNQACLAEDAGRWNDMVDCIMKIAKSVTSMSNDERNLLASAFKNYIGAKRTSWRTLSNIEDNFDVINRKRDMCKDYRVKVEEELKNDCNEVIEIVDKHLENSTDVEDQIFYLKMKGDYFRYLAELNRETQGDVVFEKSRIAYAKGLEMAKEHLSPSHPLRLGLVLNFSVYYYDILKNFHKACEMTKESVNLGEEDLQHSHHHFVNRSDSEIVLQLLKNNLKGWTAEMES